MLAFDAQRLLATAGVALMLAWAAVSAGCADDAAPCIDELALDCQPLYEPTYEQIFTRTLQPSCGTGSRCHSQTGARAGLVFTDVDESYQMLVDRDIVEPGDPLCSLLVRRVDGNGSWQMPPLPSDALLEGERCAIRKWIEAGAQR